MEEREEKEENKKPGLEVDEKKPSTPGEDREKEEHRLPFLVGQ
jgi:hypothetical protein